MMSANPTPSEVAEALRVLDLAADAGFDEVKAQYRILVHVWHPDRLPAHLCDTGTRKLQDINQAFGILKSALTTTAPHDQIERKRHEQCERRNATVKERKRRKQGDQHKAPAGGTRQHASWRVGSTALAEASEAFHRTLSEGGAGNFLILEADSSGYCYAQFKMEPGSPEVLAEVASGAYSGNTIPLRVQEEMTKRDWAFFPGENFSKSWSLDEDGITVEIIIGDALEALEVVYGVVLDTPLRMQINLE
jgi:hypothetical protein